MKCAKERHKLHSHSFEVSDLLCSIFSLQFDGGASLFYPKRKKDWIFWTSLSRWKILETGAKATKRNSRSVMFTRAKLFFDSSNSGRNHDPGVVWVFKLLPVLCEFLYVATLVAFGVACVGGERGFLRCATPFGFGPQQGAV